MPSTTISVHDVTDVEGRRSIKLVLLAGLITCALVIAIILATSAGSTAVSSLTGHASQGLFDHALSPNQDYGLVP